jgi:hypothetical protein
LLATDLAPTSETFWDRAHPKFAPLIYVLEHAGTDLIVRLMGTGLVERWGTDRTGKKAIEHDDPKVRALCLAEQLSHRSRTVWLVRH